MRELYVEGVATRNDPESCGRHREVATEALTGASMGAAIEPRKKLPCIALQAWTCTRVHCRRGHAPERSVSLTHLQRSADEANHIECSLSEIVADESGMPIERAPCPPSTAVVYDLSIAVGLPVNAESRPHRAGFLLLRNVIDRQRREGASGACPRSGILRCMSTIGSGWDMA